MRGKAENALPKGKAKKDGYTVDGNNAYSQERLIEMNARFCAAMRAAGYQPQP